MNGIISSEKKPVAILKKELNNNLESLKLTSVITRRKLRNEKFLNMTSNI